MDSAEHLADQHGCGGPRFNYPGGINLAPLTAT